MKRILWNVFIMVVTGTFYLLALSNAWAQNFYPVDSFEPVSETPSEINPEDSLFMIEAYDEVSKEAEGIDVTGGMGYADEEDYNYNRGNDDAFPTIYDNPYYDDNVDMDQQSPEFWNNI